MGSGGPRGLQILRSGVKSVRGGFDSHAFPPLQPRVWLVLLVALGALTACAGRGVAAPLAPAAADTSSTPAPAGGTGVDSLRGVPEPAVADSAPGARRVTRMRPHRGRLEAPRWVMLRSLVVPGWGQLHNGSWLKALLLGGGETALIVGVVQDDRRLRELSDEVDRARRDSDHAAELAATEAYNSRLERFVARQWLLGGVLAYALVDAYVDAHFRDFKIEFEYDPALPDGRPPSGGARLSLRWHF